MSLFVSSNCQVVGDTIVNQIAWSQSEQIAALSIYTIDDNDREINQVIFANNEGEIISKSSIAHDYEATAFAWHPVDNLLAIGWGDGMISCWMVDGKNRPSSSYSNNNQHAAPITCLKWNPLGKRLVTGDKKGVVCVWSVDSRGSLNPIRQYKNKGEITCMIFCLLPIRSLDAPAPRGGKNDSKSPPPVAFSPSFFFGTDRGAIVYADDLGHCADVQQLSSSIDSMMFFEERSRLIIITRSLLLTQYHVTEDGQVSRFQQVKLSVPGDVSERGIKSVAWAGPGLLAVATEEKIIRLLDLAADESYNISLNAALGESVSRSDRVSCVAFNPIDRYLAVGTQSGLVAIWKFTGSLRDVTGAKAVIPSISTDWEFSFKTPLGAPITQLTWHGGKGTLAVVTEDGGIILNESVMHSAMAGELYVLQTSSQEVSIMSQSSAQPINIDTGMQVRGLALGKSCFVVWNGKVAKVFRSDAHLLKFDASEAVKSGGVAMAIADSSHIVDDAWFIAENNTVQIKNFAGTQKGTISFSEVEGTPEHLDINNRYLVIVTNKGFIKFFDIHTPNKPKQLGSSGQFFTTPTNNGPMNVKIRKVKVNCTGTRVAILTDNIEGALKICIPDVKMHVYDRSKGITQTFNFTPQKRYPSNVFWDDADDRLISCEAVRNRVAVNEVTPSGPVPGLSTKNNTLAGGVSEKGAFTPQVDTSADDLESEVEVYIFFATSENGILMQDSFPRKHPYGTMIGMSVPRLYFRNADSKADENDPESDGRRDISGRKQVKIYSKVMRDFVGMDNITEAIKDAMLNFSFNLTLGKLDEAYRAVKAINSPAIWENMAHMCVKTKRLDVAEVCLGNMGHARGASALREARKEGCLEVSVGVLAIQLGLLDDAARLFRECNRFDMLNKLYQAAGLWEKAVQTANSKDRIHLKTTHFQYAKHLESIGRIDEAIENYELADVARTEVPRMLFHLGRVDELGDYVMKSDDTALLKWWAAYLESIENYRKAKKFYNKANDALSLVRIACFEEDFSTAAKILQDTGDRAAAYHFARQMENRQDYQEAINFYAISGCYNHAIRLARSHELDAELMRYALKSTPALMVECAIHFEERGELDKAVQLYHKGGDIPRALDLCFRAGNGRNASAAQSNLLYDMLNTIAQELGDGSSPQTLARCAEFLVQNKQFDKAIDLYVKAKRYHSAIEMCMMHRVTINDDMVERLTPPDTTDKAERKEILLELAKALKKQGSFSLASKKYTQAGDRLHAIKCLVRSGNTQSVIEFASITRSPEIYKIAANYLQQMNWRESVDIMKAIIKFYTLAKAFVQLAGFYDSCAQVEIDEYRDYEKAIGALKEALKYLKKDDARETVHMADSVERRITIIERFVQAKRVMRKDPQGMIEICTSLLADHNLEEAIRAGDCYSLLVEYFHSTGDMREAYRYIRDMENRQIQVSLYIDADILQAIDQAVGIRHNSNNNKNNNNSRGASQHQELEESVGEEEDHVQFHDNSSSNKNNNRGGGGGGRSSSGILNDSKEDEIDEEIAEEDEDDNKPVNNARPGQAGYNSGYRSNNNRK